jgi:hypothetical protein
MCMHYNALRLHLGRYQNIIRGFQNCYCAGVTERRSLWVRYFVIMTSCYVFATAGEFKSHWTRLNYGVIAVKSRTVCLTDGYETHTVEIKLPEQIATKPNSENSTTTGPTGPCDPLCNRLRVIANVTRAMTTSMRMSVSQLIQRIYQLVPDISEAPLGRARQRKALFSLGGRIASWILGVATDESVDTLKQQIHDQKLLTDTALADGTRTRQAMVDFTRLANERLDNMHEILNQEHHSVAVIAQRMRQISDSQFAWAHALVYTMLESARFTMLHDSITQLETGVENLMLSQLTPALIPVADIQEILDNMTRSLAANGLKPCASTARDVYESKSFQYTRHRDSLYIKLFIPYTRFPAMAVYRTTILPLPVAGHQQLITELKNFPQWIIQDEEGKFLGHLLTPVSIPVVDQSNVILHYRRKSSCLAAMFFDDAENIQRTCEFTTRQAAIEPIYIKLNASSYVIHNLTDPQITCKWNNAKPVSNHTCIPCLVTVGCWCILKSEETRIVAPMDCEKTTIATVTLHNAYNAIILQQFYDLANQSLQGDHLLPFAELTPPQPLDLPFFSGNVTKLLAADSSLSYNLNKISTALTNASSILHSPTEAVLFQYLHQMAKSETSFPNFNSMETWFILGPLPCIALLLVFTIFLHRRCKF